ncbi:MAG TPA: hypothetical protein VN853_00955, partial [Polyangia bacterium]|nr:hypothetical protein [Polyangia bacterium]
PGFERARQQQPLTIEVESAARERDMDVALATAARGRAPGTPRNLAPLAWHEGCLGARGA